VSHNFRWFAVPVVVVAVVVSVLLWRGCRPDQVRPDATPGEFAGDRITLTSPDLDLALLTVRGTAREGYTEWACLVECREWNGCRADVRVRILYVAAGEKRSLTMSGRLDAARGEISRIGRVQRPPVPVDRVDEVIVEVAAALTPQSARPTPVL